MGRAQAPPPAPHISRLTENISPVKTKWLSPHLSRSTCLHLLDIKFRRSLNSNVCAAQTRQNTKENNNINSQAKVTTNFRPTYRLLVIISKDRSYPCYTNDKVIAVLMCRWQCVSRAGSTDVRPFVNTQIQIQTSFETLYLEALFTVTMTEVHIKKGKYCLSRPGQTLWVAGCLESQIEESRHMNVASSLTLRTGHLYPPGNFPGSHFC